MNHCKDCKFYLGPDGLQGDGGNCSSPHWRLGYGTSQDAADGVGVENDEGWGFHVGPDFGCIHWEPKP